MAGFMSGFGPAFAQSFTQTRRDIEKREDDVFKLKYQDFLNTKADRNKTKADEAKAMSQAKQLAADIKDPASVPFLYKQIMDFGVGNVQKRLDDGRLTFDEGYKPQDVQEKTVRDEMDMLEKAPNISGMGARRINKRLEEVTNGSYSEVTGPQQSPYSGVDTGAYGWASPKNDPEKVGTLQDAIWNRNKAYKRGDLAAANAEQLKIDAIQESEQLQALIEANAEQDAAQTTMSNTFIDTTTGRVTTGQIVRRNDGTEVFLAGPKKVAQSAANLRQMSVAELQDRAKIRTTAGGQVEDYNTQITATMSALDISGQLITMVEADDSVLAGGTGSLATAVATGVKEIDSFVDLVGQLRGQAMKTGETEQTEKMAREAENQLRDIISSGAITQIQDTAARKKIFDNLRTLLAYRQADAMKDGRLTDQDIQRNLDIITTPTTKEAFIDGLRSVLKESVGRTYGMETVIESNSGLSVARANFEEKYGYDMYDDSIRGIDYFIDNLKGPTREFVQRAWMEVENPTMFTQTQSPPPLSEEITNPEETEEKAAPYTQEQILEELRKRGIDPDAEGAAGRKARREIR